MSNSDIPAVDHLSIEAKRQLLAILARDLLRARSGLISVEDAAGEVFVYAIPPDARARAEQAMREVDPERLAELRRRAATPERSITLEEAARLAESRTDQSR